MEKKNQTVVLLDDNKRVLDVLTMLFEDMFRSEANRINIAKFSDDDTAAHFVKKNAANIIGYIQDLNRPANKIDSPAGVSFYINVINRFTPGIKTIFLSGSYLNKGEFDLPNESKNTVRFLSKSSLSREEFRELLAWLFAPVEHELLTKVEDAKDNDFQLIELLSPTWRKVCNYLAAHPNYLHEMNPRKFEMLIAEIFKSNGWEVDLTAQTRDEGYDIVAIRRVDPTNLRVLVEAKRWSPKKPVGIQVVRSLYGLRAVQSFSQVILATSTYVSEPAKKEYQRVIPWELDFMERDAILEWCRKYSSVNVHGYFGD